MREDGKVPRLQGTFFPRLPRASEDEEKAVDKINGQSKGGNSASYLSVIMEGESTLIISTLIRRIASRPRGRIVLTF